MLYCLELVFCSNFTKVLFLIKEVGKRSNAKKNNTQVISHKMHATEIAKEFQRYKF